ncbi:MAG: helix-turn-helix transcriptional regulator, partial [Bifidobacteriaceae bacterium]|nr:helix-turn-helix transcriptional regulator [Bifidobacteriaceae bacterium]
RCPNYGYEIVRSLNQVGFESVSEGTVYPILVRLERKGLVDVARVRSELGPPRKVYTLNDAGQAGLESFWRRWDFVAVKLAEIRSRETQPAEAGLDQPIPAQSGSAQSGSAQSGSAQSGSAQLGHEPVEPATAASPEALPPEAAPTGSLPAQIGPAELNSAQLKEEA